MNTTGVGLEMELTNTNMGFLVIYRQIHMKMWRCVWTNKQHTTTALSYRGLCNKKHIVPPDLGF